MTHLNLFRLFPNSPRILVSLAFFSLSGFCSAQYFNIFPQVCDSINGTTYSYHVNGTAVFPTTGEFHAEVITNTPTPEVLFSGVQALSNPGSPTLPAFGYDVATGAFSFNAGTFPTRDLYLHLWIVLDDAVVNELYYKQ